MAETIFSRIIRREIPATIVYEDDDILAFEDIAPQAPVHTLIIPKKEIPTTNDLTPADDALVGRLVRVAAMIAQQKGIAENGYRLSINCNSDGGQVVFHLHLHLLGGHALGRLVAG